MKKLTSTQAASIVGGPDFSVLLGGAGGGISIKR
jgi:hypothetical protein